MVACRKTSVVGTQMGIQTLLKISRCTNETESVMIIIQMNPKRTDFILIHFLVVFKCLNGQP